MKIDTLESALKMIVVEGDQEKRDRIAQLITELVEARCKDRERKVVERAKDFANNVAMGIIMPLVQRLQATDKAVGSSSVGVSMMGVRVLNATTASKAADDIHKLWADFEAS